ncbi:MAG: hypothetical protein WCH84_11295 [Verrucomicrobiota bacterium]
MPYFFILPAYVLLVLGLTVAVIIFLLVREWRPAKSYIVAGTIGTFLGIVLANILVTVLGVLPFLFARVPSLPEPLRKGAGILGLGILMIGPFIASVVGVLLGFGVGLYYAYRRRHAKSEPNHAVEQTRAPESAAQPVGNGASKKY